MLKIIPADAPSAIHAARTLFEEYADSIGISPCFQNIEAELASLPGDYAPPAGRLLLAVLGGKLAGCVALRDLSDGICEMKRLYVRPKFRRHGLGRALAERTLDKAREIGYARMRLDTLPSMDSARALYASLGFRESEPYTHSPIEGAIYLELELT